MVDDHPKNPDLWKQKARAFVTRSHHHLWGKNNEDPQVFLFHQELSNAFIKQMHLGWNKHGQARTPEKWGLESVAANDPSHPGKLFLPPGIVVPYIKGKELVSLWIHPLDPSGIPYLVPGSAKKWLCLGNPENPIKKVTRLFEGLRLFQKKNSLCIEIRP